MVMYVNVDKKILNDVLMEWESELVMRLINSEESAFVLSRR